MAYQLAYDALAADLKHEGEFLPITVDGQSTYLFNCQSFAAEDRSLTERNYLDGEPDGVRSLVFDNADIANNNRCVFRSKLQGCTALYASEKFRLLCEKHNLGGLKFETDLLDIFE
ncbi:hypothetical protein [Alkalimonas amylolytica]|uniref:Uncharacterized protein n=1 Tax=Alkalimonas amylolytica TaxID=152573 RepID=A0A1H4D782_ALKAM|nr:hypothetical protein [Alkalimonas amylolytica]SEA68507.1 hypothetical protein SAMN04488051_105103 [Alkalimonas amylolytica]